MTKKIYEKPEVEVFEFVVEKGFATSINANTEDYGDGGNITFDGESASGNENYSIDNNSVGDWTF